jgi:hypothetical protein
MHLKKHIGRRNLLLIAAAVSAAGALHAGEPVVTSSGKSAKDVITTEKKEESIYDKIWGLATIYKNKDNPVIQEFKLRGRYQGQYHWVDSDQGNSDDWEDRRSRFGFDAKLFNQFEVRLDAQSSDEFDPFYNGLVDAYVKWKPSDSFALTVGRQKPQIAYYDFLQSTNNQPTFERSQIFNQLRVDRVVGAVLEGKVDKFTWQAGVYSNDIDLEFGQFDAGIAFGAGIGYNLKEALGTDKADLRFDWLHSDADNDQATILDRYEDLFTTTFWVKEGRLGLVTEFFLATGGDPGWDDAFGFYIQPTFDIIKDKLQAVGRYSFSVGDGNNSIQAQSRYERTAPEITGSGRGENYNAFYGGLQYFIYGDKLKLMAGAEYATLDGGGNGGDFDGWTVLTGVRFSF